MEVGGILVDRLNLLLKTFKQADPNLTHEKAQERVKEYCDTIKNKPDVEKIAREKITEWKHEGITKRQENTLLSFWKKSKPSISASSINTAEQTEPDVEILLACQEAKSSNQAIVASSSSSLNQQVADPDSPSSNTTDDTTRSPPPTKKTCHAENLVDRTIVKLTEEITNLEDVLRLEFVTNPDETHATLKFR